MKELIYTAKLLLYNELIQIPGKSSLISIERGTIETTRTGAVPSLKNLDTEGDVHERHIKRTAQAKQIKAGETTNQEGISGGRPKSTRDCGSCDANYGCLATPKPYRWLGVRD